MWKGHIAPGNTCNMIFNFSDKLDFMLTNYPLHPVLFPMLQKVL